MEVWYQESLSELGKVHDMYNRLESKSEEWKHSSVELKNENVKLDIEL